MVKSARCARPLGYSFSGFRPARQLPKPVKPSYNYKYHTYIFSEVAGVEKPVKTNDYLMYCAWVLAVQCRSRINKHDIRNEASKFVQRRWHWASLVRSCRRLVSSLRTPLNEELENKMISCYYNRRLLCVSTFSAFSTIKVTCWTGLFMRRRIYFHSMNESHSWKGAEYVNVTDPRSFANILATFFLSFSWRSNQGSTMSPSVITPDV